MDPLVVATWGLVIVTFLLVVLSFVGTRSAQSEAKAERAVQSHQATALSDAARATQAMADEMLEVRRQARPLNLDIKVEKEPLGKFQALLYRTGERSVLLTRAQLLVGRDQQLAVDIPMRHYMGGIATNELTFSETFEATGTTDIVTFRVTGIPENGLEQTIDFTFQVETGGWLQRLSVPGPWSGYDART